MKVQCLRPTSHHAALSRAHMRNMGQGIDYRVRTSVTMGAGGEV